MTNQELLAQALHSGAIIHQPHALKAYLSAKFLSEKLPENTDIFRHTSKLMRNDSVEVLPSYVESINTLQMSEFRIHRMLKNGVYPGAYLAIQQWQQDKGFQDIFRHFSDVASENSEYLSHNVTILLAMNCVFKELNEAQIPTFLNRFTEFVTSTFNNSNVVSFTQEKITAVDVLSACIKQFGFFGHNLITLAWLLRNKDELSALQYGKMMSNLYIQANSPVENPDDEIELSILSRCKLGATKDEFEQMLSRLVFYYTSNLHQVTLADALCLLQSEYPEYTAEFSKIAEYQCLVLEK
jgi:hypothetical protein